MSVAFSVRPYGTVDQQPPYKADVNGNLPCVQATYPADQVNLASFPSASVNVWGINPGVKMAGGVFCYSVIEVPASGLQQHSTKYVAQDLVTTITTLRG